MLFLCGRVVTTNNWYTSLQTIKLLLERSVGTVRTNKRGLPKEHVFPAKGENVKPRREFNCCQLDNDNIYFISWMDNKPVHLLSTWKPFSSQVSRVQKNKTGG